MRQFEYLACYIPADVLEGNGIDRFNALGKSGWEVVGQIPHISPNQWLFKRPYTPPVPLWRRILRQYLKFKGF